MCTDSEFVTVSISLSLYRRFLEGEYPDFALKVCAVRKENGSFVAGVELLNVCQPPLSEVNLKKSPFKT
jgi:hypothetical protein